MLLIQECLRASGQRREPPSRSIESRQTPSHLKREGMKLKIEKFEEFEIWFSTNRVLD